MIRYIFFFLMVSLALKHTALAQEITFPFYTEQGQHTKTPKPDFENFIGMKFITIPKGDFAMGGCFDLGNAKLHPDHAVDVFTKIRMACASGLTTDIRATTFEGPQRHITIDEDFQIGMFEVTIAQYNRFLVKNTRLRTKNYFRINALYDQTPNHPVMHVGIDDAKAFADWLNKTKPPEDTGTYRLPSESEWEYVARAGTKTRYWWGNNLNCLKADYGDSVCNSPGPSPVGSYLPNPFGVYDMNGNVSEWVSDCWDKDYLDAPKDGRPVTKKECAIFVHRGGSWSMTPVFLRNSDRKLSAAEFRHDVVGFRLVRDLRAGK